MRRPSVGPAVIATAAGAPILQHPDGTLAARRLDGARRAELRHPRQQLAQQALRSRFLLHRRCEAQRRIRHGQCILDLLDGDLGGRGHAGAQQQRSVVGGEHRLVGYDALYDLRAEAQLADRRLELAVGIGVDGERCLLSLLDLADVGLVDVDLDFHLLEVFGDGEQDRRLQRRGDGLAGIDIARQHDAVDRRDDARLLEIGFVERELGGRDADIGLGGGLRRVRTVIGRLGRVEILLRAGLAREQRFLAIIGQPRFLDGGLGLLDLGARGEQLGARAVDRCLELVGIELGQHVADLDHRVVVDQHLADRARQLARYVDLVGRLHRPGRGHDDRQIAPGRRLGDIAQRAAAPAAAKDSIEPDQNRYRQRRPERIAAPGAQPRPDRPVDAQNRPDIRLFKLPCRYVHGHRRPTISGRGTMPLIGQARH